MTYAQRAVAAVLGTHDDARMLTMIRSSWRCGEEFGPEFRALVNTLPHHTSAAPLAGREADQGGMNPLSG